MDDHFRSHRWNLRTFRDDRGTLSYLNEMCLPVDFRIRRVFWITGIPSGTVRGGHYHRICRQVIICLTGAVAVTVGEETIDLRHPGQCAYVPSGVCVTYKNICDDSASVVVLCSEPYDPEDTYACENSDPQNHNSGQ